MKLADDRLSRLLGNGPRETGWRRLEHDGVQTGRAVTPPTANTRNVAQSLVGCVEETLVRGAGPARCGLGLLIAGAALGLALLVSAVSQDYAPISLLLLGVIVAGWLGGMPAGVAAMTVAGGGLYYFFINPGHTNGLPTPDNALDLASFVLLPAVVMVLTTRLRSALDEVKTARQDLQLALQARADFLAQVSHDLRSPLAVVKLRAQLLIRNLAACQPAYKLEDGLREIASTADSMAGMIRELADVARLQLGETMKLELAPTRLPELVKRIAAQQEALHGQHSIRVDIETPGLVGDWDGQRIERVVQNLVGNAFKYSPPGSEVLVTLTSEEDSAQRWAVLAVHDQGIGIAPAEQGHIFDRARRGSNVGKVPGAGIGLFSAKHIVELHGGTIGVESAEGVGATFTVRLPL